MKVNSTVKMNMGAIRKLTKASITALEQTAEALHTEVVQAQVMPFDTGAMQGEKTHIKAGTTVTKEYENGSIAMNTITRGNGGRVSVITASPQARRLYFHPEYSFQKGENPDAGGKWYEDWLPGGKNEDFCQKAFAELYKRLAGL